MAKIFNQTADYALYCMSFENALMYSRSVPMPGDEKESDNTPLYDDAKDACKDIDINSNDDEIIVRK